VKATVISTPDELEDVGPAWDALAVAGERPRSAPVWAVAWYRHALPGDAVVRVVVVRDGDAVVGICPLYAVRTGFRLYRYELAAPILHGAEPLCAPGREREVGEAIGVALAGLDPTPDIVVLDWGAADSVVPAAMQRGWPAPRPEIVEDTPFPALRVVHAGRDLDGWLGERSYKFRKSFRSDYRKLQAAGFEFLTSTDAAAVVERLPDMQRLYEHRRAARHGAGPPFDATFMAVVTDAVEHAEPGRIWLATVERPGEVIAATLVMSAGGLSSAWISGFDEQWAELGPTRVNLVLCVGESIQRGDAVFDLGGGGQSYKYRFTEDKTMRCHRVLCRRGLRPFHSPAQLVPYRSRQALVATAGRARRAARAALRPRS